VTPEPSFVTPKEIIRGLVKTTRLLMNTKFKELRLKEEFSRRIG
jgi:hypothetical protein